MDGTLWPTGLDGDTFRGGETAENGEKATVRAVGFIIYRRPVEAPLR